MAIKTPNLRLSALFLCGLSLSIGWGIRGNFGHEYGAMMPGVLTAIAVCLLSGREDWRARVVYFAFFGGLGWAFGGSISYMQVISYTHSGHLPSQIFGFAGLFAIGFLWAGMGGAGTALPAVMDRQRLTALFPPLLFIFAAWFVLGFVYEPIAEFLADRARTAKGIADATWHRHESPLYWFDTDWLQALFALLGVMAFDLWDRRERNALLLPAFLAIGALAGWGVQAILQAAGLETSLAAALTRPLGDPSSPVVPTGQIPAAENFLTNWPQFVSDFPQHVGRLVGLFVGLGTYFLVYGKWRSGASLYLHMAVGWLVGFLAGPVLSGLWLAESGGLSMTPPRSEDWAGITGVFLGTNLWLLRNRLAAVSFASIVAGLLGGVAFSGAQLLKLLLTWPGNGYRMATAAQESLRAGSVAELGQLEHAVHAAAGKFAAESPFWSHWQAQNWHSVLEQSYGFFNGIAIAVAMGLLATRTALLSDEQRARRWTEVFSASFVVIGVTYLNLVKNVRVWTDGDRPAMPPEMQMPLVSFPWANWSAWAWFSLIYAALAVAFVYLCIRHLRRPLAIVPTVPLGKGQLLFLIFLWAVVIGNFERQFPHFAPGRLITEGVIFMNAILATTLILCLPRNETLRLNPRDKFAPLVRWACLVAVLLSPAVIVAEVQITRMAYGNHWSGHSGYHLRLGEKAGWRIKPNLKAQPHR